MRYQGIFFDLDGTLVDNFDAIHASYVRAATALGFEPVSHEVVRRSVGGSIPVTLGKLLPREVVPAAEKLYVEAFADLWDHGLRALPGASAIIAGLRARGVRCAVLTNKTGDRSRAILDRLGLLEGLEFVQGTGDAPGRKPEEGFTRAALARLGLPADAACMIGDSPYDLATARGVGMSCYTVATGSHSPAELAADGAHVVCDDLHQLARRVFGFETTAS